MITPKARQDLDLLQRFLEQAKLDLSMTDDTLWCYLGHDANELMVGEGRRKLRCECYLEEVILKR